MINISVVSNTGKFSYGRLGENTGRTIDRKILEERSTGKMVVEEGGGKKDGRKKEGWSELAESFLLL